MKLDTYLKERGQSQADFGASLTPPVTQALVSQWILGKTAVSLHYSLEIFRKTGGGYCRRLPRNAAAGGAHALQEAGGRPCLTPTPP